MSILRNFARWGRSMSSRRFGKRHRDPHCLAAKLRVTRFEQLEIRNPLTAAPPQIHFGSVFFDAAPGANTTPNTIQITFQGGAPNTQLTQLVIDGSKNQLGLAVGDIVWKAPGGGQGGSSPLTIVSHTGFQVLSATAINGGTQIVITLSGFDPGETLVLTDNAEQITAIDPNTGAVTTAPLAKGNDFQSAHLVGTFTAPHFENITVNTAFVAGYDTLFHQNDVTSGTVLNLPPQDYQPPSSEDQSDQTTGASVLVTQTPLPISLAGTVYNDPDLNNIRESGEQGIANVSLTLYSFDGTQFVSTGKTTKTDANGNYIFKFLLPGTYQVAETQPTGYFSVGATAGTVGGVTDGIVVNANVISQISVLGGDNSIQNDFALAQAIGLSGYVYHDPNNNGIREPGENGIGGATIIVQPISALDGSTNSVQVVTGADGYWSVSGLAPGVYTVYEPQQPPGYLDGKTTPGSLGGTFQPIDQIVNITVLGGQSGVEYDFGKLLPASLSGNVDDCLAGVALSGVTVQLLDAGGNVINTTTTDNKGNYQFSGLTPGQIYGVNEILPPGYMHNDETVGSAGGVIVNDAIVQIPLGDGVNAINYNFCDVLPASLSGSVADCLAGVPLSGVTVQLLDADGNVIKTTLTDAKGDYQFSGLKPGLVYGVDEILPPGYIHNDETVGSAGGIIVNDAITQVPLGDGVNATDYDFCDVRPASISGKVWNDTNGDCVYQPQTDIPLSGVQIDLLDNQGHIVVTTTTDEQGNYKFDQLRPGTYSVFEHEPSGYLKGMDLLGTVDGVADGVHGGPGLLSQILLGSGAQGIHYDFCEELPVSISGTVWNDTNGDCIYQPQIDAPLAGVQIDLRDSNGATIATTSTDAQGNYKFQNLTPGTYSVFEHQPAGFLEGMDILGTVGGITVGTHGGTDLLSQIVLNSGAAAINYDFCEELPASLSGKVWNDTNGDCIYQPETDVPLSGVQIDLLDSNGHVVATTTTDAGGNYKFEGLVPGTYSLFEHQPAGFLEGMDLVGTVGGIAVGTHGGTDLLSQIVLGPEAAGLDYDFCEQLPAGLSGTVWNDTNGDCVYQPGTDVPLSGVQIDLLDSNGHVVATTTTDAGGNYKFEGLVPGTYSLFEHQPAGFLEGMDMVGTVGGITVGTHGGADLLSQIKLGPGATGIDYDFCEELPASLSGYVFQDGPPIVLLPGQSQPDVAAVRDGKRTAGDKPIPGVTLLLYDGVGNPILDSQGHQLTAKTNATGFYQFTGLRAGTYIIRELQPGGFIDGIDTPGATGGVADNHNTPQSLIPPLPFNPNFDVIVSIPLGVGQNSQENNFSEVVVQQIAILTPPTNPPLTTPPLATAVPPLVSPLVIPPYSPLVFRPDIAGADVVGYTWHLSIIDAGYPRGEVTQFVAMNLASASAPKIDWSSIQTTPAEWIFLDANGHEVHRKAMGIKNAIPVAGDFNGDGVWELGLYIDGQWFIDLNGNGQWDAGDLWAKLGTRDDNPVVGDWDGDGKADIGIYGPAWSRDPHAVRADPGLPDPMNKITGKRKKNIPPQEEDAAAGRRRMQLGAQGKIREELIDHVFHYGTAVERPVVGDWTGSGLRRVGVFRNGHWYLDMNGDGRWSKEDVDCLFGQAGDIPVVGDWTGDGIEKIGVYRNGTWYLDTNNNHKLDEGDRVLHLGQPGDLPVVGDFNGEGHASIGVYRPGAGGDAHVAEAPEAPAPTPAVVK